MPLNETSLIPIYYIKTMDEPTILPHHQIDIRSENSKIGPLQYTIEKNFMNTPQARVRRASWWAKFYHEGIAIIRICLSSNHQDTIPVDHTVQPLQATWHRRQIPPLAVVWEERYAGGQFIANISAKTQNVSIRKTACCRLITCKRYRGQF